MGFLDNLFNKNPTADWQPQRGLELVLDIGQETFCGITFGDPASRASKFGPAEVAKLARIGYYTYWSRGFELTTEEGRVVEFEVAFLEGRQYHGSVVANGQSLPLSSPVTEREVVALLGQPTKRDVSGEPPEQTVVLSYGRPKGDWDFEFDEKGLLETIWGGKRD